MASGARSSAAQAMRVALGVSGGVAAYKAAELVRRLQQEQHRRAGGDDAQRAGIHHAADLCRADRAKSHHRTVWRRSRHANVESAIEHIAVAQRIDALVIAPATANVIAKMARGIADDFLTTLYLATTAPVIVAPAMNVNMWEHAATQENIEMLRARGVHVVAPDEGYLACGMTGAGRLAGFEAIARSRSASALGFAHDLGRRNRAGDRRTHVRGSGPGALSHQSLLRANGLCAGRGGARGAALVSFWSAARRRSKRRRASSALPCAAPRRCIAPCWPHLAQATVVIMAAAVADYRPVAPQPENQARIGAPDPRTRAHARIFWPTSRAAKAIAVRRRLCRRDRSRGRTRPAQADAKAADLIVANDVTAEGAGFDHDTNIVTIFMRDGREQSLPRMSKIRGRPSHSRPSRWSFARPAQRRCAVRKKVAEA